MRKIIITCICILFSWNSFAYHKNRLNACTPDKPTHNNYEPELFGTTNNLLRKTGCEEVFCGQRILLKLEVVDKNCVPIADAKVKLWQAGCDGKYPYKPLRKATNPKYMNIKSGASFTGSGLATTNNLGNVEFITIYPVITADKDHPHINIRVEHSRFGSFQTKLYLSKHEILEDGQWEVIERRITTPWESAHRRY